MNEAEILVTGGTGALGKLVVARLQGAGRDVRVLSRRARTGTMPGDLATGEGLEAAVKGVGAVVHCASSPVRNTHRVDVGGTRRLLQAAKTAGVSHFVYVSIVGVDLNPNYPYYRAKLEAEHAVERSGLPWTILRATQFHGFVLSQIESLQFGPLALAPRGFLLQPIDVGEVADRLVELAFGEPIGRAPDVGGPEVRTFADLARSYQKVAGHRRRLVEVPVPGKTARAFRQGAQISREGRYGRVTWEQFLHGTVPSSETRQTRGKGLA